jgi:hypothetical protein
VCAQAVRQGVEAHCERLGEVSGHGSAHGAEASSGEDVEVEVGDLLA